MLSEINKFKVVAESSVYCLASKRELLELFQDWEKVLTCLLDSISLSLENIEKHSQNVLKYGTTHSHFGIYKNISELFEANRNARECLEIFSSFKKSCIRVRGHDPEEGRGVIYKLFFKLSEVELRLLLLQQAYEKCC